MKHTKDPFEAATEEEKDESPVDGGDVSSDDGRIKHCQLKKRKTYLVAEANNKDENQEEDMEEEVELTKFRTSSNPMKKAMMQTILAQFTKEQMSRYEFFRRSTLDKKPMKNLLERLIGRGLKPDAPMKTVVCSIAKMFVGELVETARIVMRERKESGPIRPCHIRESYRRLKLQGKVPQRSVPRLFH